jgi:hypothetical protein
MEYSFHHLTGGEHLVGSVAVVEKGLDKQRRKPVRKKENVDWQSDRIEGFGK